MTSPRTLLKVHNLRAKKSLGQNFLSDPNTASKLVTLATIDPDDTVLEIGSGLGALTIPLAKAARHVLAIETDPQLVKILNTELLVHKVENVTLMPENVLTLDFLSIAAQAGQKLVVMGNLPYNISSQILVRLIAQRRAIARCVFMFQKELAERLKAGSGTKRYGRLTVMLRYCASIHSLAVVEAHLFFPKPKVNSEVLEFNFHGRGDLNREEESFLFQVIKAAFGQRRKTLKNALNGSDLSLTPTMVNRALNDAGIEARRRAESLEVVEFIALSRALTVQMTSA